MTPTRTLAEFVATWPAAAIPPSTLDRTRDLLLDYLGVALAGSRAESSVAVRALVDDTAPGEATVIGRARGAAPAFAALANGAAAHAIEMDDTHQEGSIHLGATVFSALIAASDQRRATVADFLVAAVMGYEVAARLAMALDPAQHYARGFHPTGTCGAPGAAAAVARLRGLDAARTTNALGVAASQSAGLMEFLTTGAWSKRLHPGWAAHSGLVSAGLAEHGFTGPSTALEGARGFLHAFSGAPRPDRLTRDLGRVWAIDETSVKAHACCRYMQAPIDAVLALRAEHQLTPDQVERLTLGILDVAFPIICEPASRTYAPGSVVDAQFSMPFGAAVALVQGRASLAEFTPAVIASPAVRAVMARVSHARDAELDRDYPRAWPAWAKAELSDGRTLSARVVFPKGDPQNPLTRTELVEKFRSLGGRALAPGHVEEIVECVRTLDGDRAIHDLWRLVRRG